MLEQKDMQTDRHNHTYIHACIEADRPADLQTYIPFTNNSCYSSLMLFVYILWSNYSDIKMSDR